MRSLGVLDGLRGALLAFGCTAGTVLSAGAVALGHGSESPGANGVHGEGARPEVPHVETQVEAEAGRRLRPVLRRLEDLPEDQFLVTAELLLEESPQLALDAILLQAGRPLPPGLTAARIQQRRAVQAAALGLIRSDLENLALGQRWRQRIDLHLGSGTSGASTVDLRAAAMLVAAKLDLVHLAPRILGSANPSPRGVVETSALEALRILYGRWVPDKTTLRGLMPLTDPGQVEARRAFHLATSQIRELWLRLLESDPSVAKEIFGGPDPDLRAHAASRLLSAIGKQELQREEVAALLLGRVRAEPEAAALHAALVALVEMAQAAGPQSAITADLREVLRERASTVSAYLAPVLLAGLERLPAAPELPAGQPSPTEGIDSGGVASTGKASGDAEVACSLMVRLLERGAPVDGDNLVVALGSWSLLVERAAERGRPADLHGSRRLVSELLENSGESVAVRMAAAKALGRLEPELDRLAARLDLLDRQTLPSALRVMIYSLVEEAVQGPDPVLDGPTAEQLVACLTRDSAATDSEVRRRVVRLLGSVPIVDAVRAQGLEPLVAALLDAAIAEPLSDLQTAMLQRLQLLCAGRAHPERLEQLLSSADPGRLRRPEETRTRALSGLLVELAGDSGGARMRAARWMAQEPDAGGDSALLTGNETHKAKAIRLESALRILVGLSSQAAAGLAEEEHRSILHWATELQGDLGRVQLGSTSAWLSEPVIDQHLAALPRATWSGEWFLLEGRLLGARAGATESPEAVLSAYASALALPDIDERTRVLVHRDRLRFLQRLIGLGGDPSVLPPPLREPFDLSVTVLAAGLIDTADEPMHLAADELLDLTDISRLAANAGEARLWGRLVIHREWRNLPASERMEHLLSRSSSALAAADEGDWAPLAEVVRTLGVDEREQVSSGLWSGLGGEESDLQKLRERAAIVLERMTEQPQ